MTASLTPNQSAGNTFVISLQGDGGGAGTSGQCYRMFKVAIKDETTLEQYTLSFVAYGLSGSW
jgi:hypothetical protein